MAIAPDAITPSVYLVDMLDWLDYVTFDSGPGQMMLRAARFFGEFDDVTPKTASIKDKLERLMALYEDGERRLKENRKKLLDRYRQQYKSFMADSEVGVTSESQEALNLQ